MIQVTALPFVEHFVLVREYDQACLLYLHGEKMRIVSSNALTPRRKVGPYYIKEIPLVCVERKEGDSEND
jgi:hypothetical protein